MSLQMWSWQRGREGLTAFVNVMFTAWIHEGVEMAGSDNLLSLHRA